MNRNILRAGLLGLCTLLILAFSVGVFLPTSRVSADNNWNWLGQYWSNKDLSGSPTLTRTDSVIGFNWGYGSPDPSIPADGFSARWTTTINFPAATYRFRGGADDGIRAWVDGNTIIDQWHDATSGGFTNYTADVTLTAGTHSLKVEYYENTGLAGVVFDWLPLTPISGTPVPIGVGGTIVAAAGPRCEVRVDVANVRNGPSTEYTKVGEILFSEQYQIVGVDDGRSASWLLLVINGVENWTFARNCFVFHGDLAGQPVVQSTAIIPTLSANQTADGNLTGTATANLVIRDQPSRRGSKIIGSVKQDESFRIIALSRNHAWVKIVTSGNIVGWIFVPYVNTDGDLGSLPIRNE